MPKIGNWDKNPASGGNHYEWFNSTSKAFIKVFKHPGAGWNVSVLRPGHLYDNLLGGKSYKENQSKSNAFKIARQYMKDNPR